MNFYDCVIIGGGISGLSASIYLARAGLKTLILESSQIGGQIINSVNVENYPGYKSISGYDLIDNIKTQAESLGVEIINDEVIKLESNKAITKMREYNFKTAIIASGLKRKTLGIEEDYIGKGVSYCATCDGAFFKNKTVAVVGGGNTALDDALYLSNLVSSVYLIHRRSEFRGNNKTLEKLKTKDNVTLVLNKNIISLNGDNTLESITLDDNQELKVDGLFIAIGMQPDSNYFKDLIDVDEDGFIKSDNAKTNIPNIFVAGDIREKEVRQLITAASDGVIAATNCISYINS